MFARLKHWFGRHSYFYLKRLTLNSHILGCEFCKKRFVLNTSVKTLIEWDLELEDYFNAIPKRQVSDE